MNLVSSAISRSLSLLKWHHLFPHNRWGDAWHARLHCLRYNGHWPRAVGGGINDFLAFLKGSPEIDHPFRRLSSDKYLLKQWLDEYLGPGWSVPTLGYLASDQQIEGFDFPSRCVIKPTHLSGQIIRRKEGEPVDRRQIRGWLRLSHYDKMRERNYRGVQPGVLVEPYLPLHEGREFKVYTLRGEPRVIVWRDGDDRLCTDATGRSLGIGLTGLKGVGRKMGVARPQDTSRLPELLGVVRKVAAQLLFARVDFYQVGQQFMIGEITHVPMAGTIRLIPTEAEGIFTAAMFAPRGFCLSDYPEITYHGGSK